MNRFAKLLFLAASLSAHGAGLIRQEVLDPGMAVRVPVSRERLTTVRFPSPISDLEGTYLSAGVEPPARFQISFQPGRSSFALRALATNVNTTLTVGWRGQLQVLELVESSEPLSVLDLLVAPPPPPPAAARSITPARLRALLQIARLHSEVELQQPALLDGTRRYVVNASAVHPDCEVILEQVFHFAADDTLVFDVRFVNQTTERIAFLPSSLGARVGDRPFVSSLTEAEGVVPPCGTATVAFAISGGVNGTPEGLSPRNKFQVTFERIGPLSKRRCPAPPSGPRIINPARSPKDANR